MMEQELSYYETPMQLDELGVEEAIENVKEIEADMQRLKDLAEAKKTKIDEQLQLALMPLEKRLAWQKLNVRLAVEAASDAKSTKTQVKKVYLSGEVVITKPKLQVTKPDDKNNKAKLKEAFPEFFQEESVEKFKWADLKKELVLDEKTGKVYYQGEDVTELVPAEMTKSELTIK